MEFQANIAPRRKTRQDGEARNVGNEGMRMLYPDDDEAELREAIEQGRRHKIAAEVLKEFLDNRKEEIMREFEEKYLSDGTIYDKLAELRVMRKFMDMSAKMISIGEIAEERMKEIGG